jgi:DNA-binding beta-propeller fold protein YncE
MLDTPGVQLPSNMSLSPDETTLAIRDHSGAGHCIKVVRMDGSEAPRTVAGVQGTADGQFYLPFDVYFTPDGQQLVVADHLNSRVQVLGLDGSFVRKMPLGGKACCVAVDAAGNIIAGTPKHVKVFSPEGTLLHDRLGGIEMGGFHVVGLAVDPDNNMIAVGDMMTGKVHLL